MRGGLGVGRGVLLPPSAQYIFARGFQPGGALAFPRRCLPGRCAWRPAGCARSCPGAVAWVCCRSAVLVGIHACVRAAACLLMLVCCLLTLCCVLCYVYSLLRTRACGTPAQSFVCWPACCLGACLLCPFSFVLSLLFLYSLLLSLSLSAILLLLCSLICRSTR